MTSKSRSAGAARRTRTLAALLLPLALAWIAVGCGPSPQEQLIHEACQALKAQDWDAYSALTITEADFLLAENGIPENEANESFAGGSMRPQQRQALREQFERAVRGGDHSLDFSRCLYITLTRGGNATRTTLSGGEVDLEEYLLTIEMDGPELSTPGLGPYFILARWQDGYRIIGLRWPREG